jgi:hypothetical protein
MMTQRDIALLREFLERFKRICPDADGKADPAALMNAGRASESAPRLQSKAKGCDDLVVVLLYLGTRRYTSYSCGSPKRCTRYITTTSFYLA